jgi:hypothetical protein
LDGARYCLTRQGDGLDVGIAQAAAAAALIAAIRDEPAVVIQIGTILILKQTSATGEQQLEVRSLSANQMIYIEDHPQIMKQPSELLQVLDGVRGDDFPLGQRFYEQPLKPWRRPDGD